MRLEGGRLVTLSQGWNGDTSPRPAEPRSRSSSKEDAASLTAC